MRTVDHVAHRQRPETAHRLYPAPMVRLDDEGSLRVDCTDGTGRSLCQGLPLAPAMPAGKAGSRAVIHRLIHQIKAPDTGFALIAPGHLFPDTDKFILVTLAVPDAPLAGHVAAIAQASPGRRMQVEHDQHIAAGNLGQEAVKLLQALLQPPVVLLIGGRFAGIDQLPAHQVRPPGAERVEVLNRKSSGRNHRPTQTFLWIGLLHLRSAQLRIQSRIVDDFLNFQIRKPDLARNLLQPQV